MYVCLCKGITDKELRTVVQQGATSFRKVAQETGCATQCGSCACMAKEIIDSTLAESGDNKLFHAA